MGRNLTITSLLVFVELECRKMRAKKPTPLSCSEGKGEWGVESFCKLVYKRNVLKKDPWSPNYQAPLRAIQSRRSVTLSVPICRVISFCLVMGRLS